MGSTGDILAGGLLDFFGLLFGYAGAVKLATLRRFRYQLLASGLGRAGSLAVATLVPALELASALGVLARVRTADCMAAIVLLLAGFTIYLAVVVLRGKQMECHCFGGDEGAVDRTTIFRNLLLLALAGLAWFGAFRGGGAGPWTIDRALFSGYAVVAAILFVAAIRLLAVRKELREAA